jgi:hypothetical protein
VEKLLLDFGDMERIRLLAIMEFKRPPGKELPPRFEADTPGDLR